LAEDLNVIKEFLCVMAIAGVVGTHSLQGGHGDDSKLGLATKKVEYVGPDAATKKRIDGNRRFVNGESQHPNQSAERRLAVAKGQKPFAVVVTCSDSRVCPEILFDQGLGDLFVIRVAGNTIGNLELGSIEYAVEHLEAHLVIVVGHERCGAVDAAIKGGHLPGHIGELTTPIKPAVDATKGYKGDIVDAAVRHNAKYVAENLKVRESLIKELIAKGEVKVLGARYDLDSGLIEILD
jgi:carbonic anhydrase